MPAKVELWARRFLRLLVWLYPRPFRSSYGRDLQDAYVDRLSALWRQRRWMSVLALGARAVWHSLRDGTLERFSRRRSVLPRSAERPAPLAGLVRDAHYATRRLRRQPLFSAVSVGTLTLGIGANAAIFSVVNAVVLRPLPFTEPDQLVMLCETNPEVARACSASPPNAEDWARLSTAMSGIGVARPWPFVLKDDQGAEGLYAGVATPGVFELFDLPTAHGRVIAEPDMQPGDNRVVVLSHAFWSDRFGANAALVGDTILLDDEPYRVIGVLASGAEVPGMQAVQLWAPLGVGGAMGAQVHDRAWRGFTAFGRIRTGVEVELARADLEAVQAALADEYPDSNAGWGIAVRPLHDEIVGPARTTLLVFLAAVGVVLLIACANVANLGLAQTGGRLGELSLRAAIGARRRRLIQLLLVEGSLLSLAGGILGLGIAVWATEAFVALAPAGIPRLDEVSADARVLSFTAGVTVLTTLLFGVAPALRSARTDARAVTTIGSVNPQRAGVSGARLRGGLVVAQIALALVLLITAGLLTRSFAGFLTWQPQLNRANLLAVWILSSPGKYDAPAEILQAHEQAAAQVAALPSVASVAFASGGPLFGSREAFRFRIEGAEPPAPGQEPVFRWYDVGEDYFSILGRPILYGRGLRPTDGLDDPDVALINETAVASHFGATDPIGRRVQWLPEGPEFEIVGVVRDIEPFVPGAFSEPEIYVPYAQLPRGATYLLVQTRGAAAVAARDVRERLRANDPDMQITPMTTFEELEARQLRRPRFNMLLLGIFAAVALTLATVGIYGVMAYGVTTRTHEIGVRLALGATPAQVRGEVLRRGTVLAVIGVVVGSVGALAAGTLIAGLPHGVESTDPVTFAAAAVGLVLVAIAACYVPACRASRLDPIDALR